MNTAKYKFGFKSFNETLQRVFTGQNRQYAYTGTYLNSSLNKEIPGPVYKSELE